MRGLYAITPESSDLPKLVDQVGQAVAGGASAIQYRNKSLSPGAAILQAKALQTLLSKTGVLFIINDNIELALAIRADGVHVGKQDSDLSALSGVREHILSGRFSSRHQPFLIGVSCYNDLQRAKAAVAAGADYVAFGSFFPSQTKPDAAKADVMLIKSAKIALDVPVVAIGGITLENAPQLIAARVDAIAVITDLFGADDISHRARQFTNLFNSGNHV
ncbi:MAG: thiamine phosphate synthase [Betaproteobacteria bacterium]